MHGSLFTTLFAAFERLSAQWRRSLELSANEFLVLFQLWTHPDGAMSMGQAGDLVNVTSGGLTSIVVRLERAGYVARSVDPDDRRRTILALTPHGQTVRDRLMHPFAEHVALAAPADLEQLIATITDRLDGLPEPRGDGSASR